MLFDMFVRKTIRDIDIKLDGCKTNFQWKFLAEQFERLQNDITRKFSDDDHPLPDKIQELMVQTREKLVRKKSELPPEDLLV